MSGGLEAVGDAATGAILARAVEPDHGGADGDAHGHCANCGTPLIGAYCHGCGQNSHIHRTISGFMHDLLHGVFHFEGKIWHTLPLLLLKPGDLTRRYIAGERAKFISPLALYLFCTFLMFAVVGSLAGEIHAPEISDADKHKPLSEIRGAIVKNEAAMAKLRAQIKAEEKADHDTTALEKRFDALEEDTDKSRTAEKFLTGGSKGDFTVFGFKTGWDALDHGIQKANENPDLFLYRLQSSAYKYSWLLIPISTPMVWLLFFWKRKYKFYDHLVFVTFSLTFMLLLVTALTVAGVLGLWTGAIVLTALIVPPLHMYKQVRGAYSSGRVTALLRTLALIIFGSIALTLYLVILLALGVTH